MDTVLRNVIWTFFFLCSCWIVMFNFILLLISCSAIRCGCTFYQITPRILSVQWSPHPRLVCPSSIQETWRKKFIGGIIWLSYCFTIEGTSIFDGNIVTGLYLVQKWGFFCSFSSYSPSLCNRFVKLNKLIRPYRCDHAHVDISEETLMVPFSHTHTRLQRRTHAAANTQRTGPRHHDEWNSTRFPSLLLWPLRYMFNTVNMYLKMLNLFL